jgi:hypothetical protein
LASSLALAALLGCDGTAGTLITLTDASSAGAGAAGGSAGAGGMGPDSAPSWQIQLTGSFDTSFDVERYEADLFALDAAAVRAVHEPGHTLTCYVSVGTAEPWRSDYMDLPSAAIGNALSDYPQERWLDVRNQGVRDVMTERLALAASIGCDAVELSNLGAHLADSGFALSQADEVGYGQWLISTAHARGLAAGVSGSDDLVPLLVADADWGLTEECLAYDSCAVWQAFTKRGKPVFMIEYGSANDAPVLCPEAAKLGFSLVIKRRALDAFRVGCQGISLKP